MKWLAEVKAVEKVAVPGELEKARLARQKLSDVVSEAWRADELQSVRSNLKRVGEQLSDPYHDAAAKSEYAKILRETAERLGLRELMRSAWGK